MARNGCSERYDQQRLVRFVADLKDGVAERTAPVYSQLVYDILAGEMQAVRQSDILILEGLTVLDGSDVRSVDDSLFVSDHFDFSIYVDAPEVHIREWFLQRSEER